MMPYRAPATLDLGEAERAELEGWARRRKTAQALALRARIVLRAAAGSSNTAIAAELGIAKHTVGKWRERFAKDRRSKGSRTNPAAVPHARSRTSGSPGCWSARSRPRPRTPPTGAPARWPQPAGSP